MSVGTVSHVLNRPGVVAAATRERIERTMAELGYVPDFSARRLRVGSGSIIGVQVLDIANPFWGEIVRGVEDVARDAGYVIMVCSSSESAEIEARNLELLRRHRVDGLLVAPVDADERRLQELAERGTPVVLIDHRSDGGRLPAVAVDDVTGGELAAAHVLGAGHQRIALVNGPPEISWCRDRRDGIHRAVRARGLDPAGVVSELRVSGLNAREGEAAIDRLLELPDRPTALVCTNDLLALGALRGLNRAGVRVPEDLALVGYDDVDFAEMLSPALTTVRQRPFGIGRAAADLLLRRLAEDSAPSPTQLLIAPELIVRASA